MNKKRVTITVCGILLICAYSLVYAADLLPGFTDQEHKKLTEIIEKDSVERLAEKDRALGQDSSEGTTVEDNDVTSYEDAMVKAATQQQKDTIAEIKASGSPSPLFHKRAVKIILGELPADQPRITVEEAKTIVAKITAAPNGTAAVDQSGDIMAEFDRIHGAPDVVGGSGLYRTIYVLNEDPPTSIIFMEGSITLRTLDPKHPDQFTDFDLLKKIEMLPYPTER